MALGRRREACQEELFVPHERLPRSEGHAFYRQLNRLLGEAQFDRYVERLCVAHYQRSGTPGRPSIPPGVYFRMLLVGYFEGIGSQRGIAWRCHDSLSLREFLGVPLSEDAPDHSSLTRVRDRLPLEVHAEAFRFVLQLADEKGLLKGKIVGVDSTTLEASAAMKSIVRKNTGEDWRAYVVGLMKEQGVVDEDAEPTDEEIRRFDKRRKNKKVSNENWESPTDPDARIARMKDGRTHLAYKAEHVVDLDSELILAAEVYHADYSDHHTLVDSVMEAQGHLRQATGDMPIEEVAADKGYHAAEQLELAESLSLRTYIAEPERKHKSRWTDKRPELKAAVCGNRRRTKRAKSKRLQRLRSERVERSFAHVCETGGARRTWLGGIDKVRKRYLIAALARNLGVMMRALFGMGTPRGLEPEVSADDGLAALLQLARLLARSFTLALTAFRTLTSNLRQQTTHHDARSPAA
jgi:IS5 family transposase